METATTAFGTAARQVLAVQPHDACGAWTISPSTNGAAEQRPDIASGSTASTAVANPFGVRAAR
jgi:hypothetical protein